MQVSGAGRTTWTEGDMLEFSQTTAGCMSLVVKRHGMLDMCQDGSGVLPRYKGAC